MSGTDGESNQESQGGAGRREVAWRVFAAEYDDADFDYSESDEERAPNYVVTPTGARVNRLFVVGVLTEVEQVGDDVLRGRVVDPTGAFVLYAGQYQPDEMAFLEKADPPAFVAVTGKARTFRPEDSDRVFTSIRPESINRVNAETRDRWVVQTAEQTLARVSTFADAIDSGERGDDLREALEASGVDAGLAAGVPLALDHYGTTKGYLAEVRDLALDSARVVAGELDADDVGPLELDPEEGGDEVDADLDFSLTGAEGSDLAELESESGPTESAAEPTETDVETDTDPAGTDTDPAGTDTDPAETDSGAESASATDAGDDRGGAPPGGAGGPAAAASPATAEGESDGTEVEDEAIAEAETSADTEAEDSPEVEDADDAAELQESVGDEEPPTVESEQDTSTDEEFAPETDADEDADLGTGGAGDEMYEFDDEEREQIEEEHGLEFSSGSEVDSPEESDFDPPDPDDGLDEGDGEPGEGESASADQHAEPTADEVDADELQEVESASGGTEEAVDAADEAPEGGETAAAEAPGGSVGEGDAGDSEATSDEAGDAEQSADESESGDGETPEDLEDAVMDEMRELNDGDGVERETLLAAVVQAYDVTPADVEDALEAALMAGRCYESGEETLKPI